MKNKTPEEALAAMDVIDKRLGGYGNAKETLRTFINQSTAIPEDRREALAWFESVIGCLPMTKKDMKQSDNICAALTQPEAHKGQEWMPYYEPKPPLSEGE